MATETLNREELINVIWEKKGKVSLVAREMGVSTVTIYTYVKRYSTVKNALDSARLDFEEILLDNAEVGLQKQVLEQKAWAIRYALDKKGHGRGYVDRQEHTGEQGGEIILKVIHDR